jgi:hypothetical protein
MKNHKQLIGIFRIIIYIVAIYSFDFSLDPYDLKIWASDMIHGAHTPELRETASVWLVRFLVLGASSFYIIQSFVYIFIGNALNGKNTGLFRFLRILVRDSVEAIRDPYFWTNSSTGGDLGGIEKVLSYRDNKMALMTNKEAAEYMRGTGHVDMMLNRPDLKQSRKTLSYLNNKIAFMDNESALEFLKGSKK